MTKLRTTDKYYHFEGNGHLISIPKIAAGNNQIKAFSMAIEKLNIITSRFKTHTDERWKQW